MWEKIKGFLAVIGAFITVVACTIVLVFFRRRDSDRFGSTGASERDTEVKDGIGECEERADGIKERIERAESSAGRCEEHLHRAEEILRNAVERSRKKESDT